MCRQSRWSPAVAFLLLVGCAATPVAPAVDPLTKLNDAELLFRQQDQPVPAEKMIREAMAVYAERDDAHGLGNAYREYADLLRSRAVSGRWASYYREHGFQDRTVTYENRIEKSAEYYGKAIHYYSRAESRLRKTQAFGPLTNVYFNMAASYYQLGDKDKACAYFGRTLDAYEENVRRNPGARPYSPTGSVPGLVRSLEQKAGCA